jgi:cytochrome c peroxidase
MLVRPVVLGLVLSLSSLSSCTQESQPAAPKAETKVVAPAPPPAIVLPPAAPLAATPRGLPELSASADNPLTAEKVDLGRQLFFDKRLSKDGSAACTTCHVHEKGWTDGLALSTKVGGAVNTRHSPTLYNVGYLLSWYWDGRAATLEKQVEAAWKGQLGADPAAVATALAAVPTYKASFQRAFAADPSPTNVSQALASFVRTLRSGAAPWDLYEKGDKTAVPEDAVKGYALFTGKAQCSLCHVPPHYTDSLFHNVGVGMSAQTPDPGRAKVTSDAKDTGAFKTPTLRSITKSAPYFHDGHQATLEGAVAFMVGGGTKNANLDPKLKPVKLSAKELGQLLAFLKALESTETFAAPELP